MSPSELHEDGSTSARGSFYRHHEGVLEPLPAASSGWNSDHIRGPAITGVLARAAEQVNAARDRRPARAVFELFRPALMVPSTIRTTVVRTGRRLTLIDSELVQADVVVARGHVLFLTASQNPEGRIWEPLDNPVAPPAGIPTDEEGRVYKSGAGPWTSSAADHNNEQSKSVWQEPRPIVHGELPTAFQCVASTGDLTSLVVHWGDLGVEFINADVTIALSRLPTGPDVGVSVNHRTADEGISAGAGVLFDRQGAFGTASVVGLANAHNAVAVGRR